MEFAKGDLAAGVGIGRRLVHSGTPSPNAVAHVLDSAYVLVCESCVAGRRTSVEHVERASHSFLLKWHDLATPWFVEWEHSVGFPLLYTVQEVLCRLAPNAMSFVKQLGVDGLLELAVVLVSPELQV